MSDDPCECVFNHAAMMRRLISILRDSQNDCIDSDCSSSSFSSGGDNNMMMIAMAWGLLAMFLFYMRPSSMRSNGGQLEGKPTMNQNEQGDNDPPPPPDVH